MKAFFVLALAAVALADNRPTYAPRTTYAPRPTYAPRSYQPAPSYKEEPANYQYQYQVQDDYANLNFGANEARDGYATNGGYQVLLPDGRTQIVTYNVADGYSGYVADVQYEGEARYPEYKPTYAPRPAYKSAPTYAPAPSYN